MDSNPNNWCFGTGTVGQDQFDFQAAVTHEFGHATGRGGGTTDTDQRDTSGHFKESTSYCNTTEAEHHTMCQSIIANRNWDRSLNDHDKDIFYNQY